MLRKFPSRNFCNFNFKAKKNTRIIKSQQFSMQSNLVMYLRVFLLYIHELRQTV
jgi:hypothetical protein